MGRLLSEEKVPLSYNNTSLKYLLYNFLSLLQSSCCKYAVFKIRIQHKNSMLFQLFQSHKTWCICQVFWAFLKTEIMIDFPTLSYPSTGETLPFHLPRLKKVPLSYGTCMSHHRGYHHPFHTTSEDINIIRSLTALTTDLYRGKRYFH